jgi:hypothetical protein
MTPIEAARRQCLISMKKIPQYLVPGPTKIRSHAATGVLFNLLTLSFPPSCC